MTQRQRCLFNNLWAQEFQFPVAEVKSNMFIYQAGFLTSSVFAETLIYEAFVLIGGNIMVLLCIAFMEERECAEKLGRMKYRLASTFSFIYSSNADKLHLSSTNAKKAS